MKFAVLATGFVLAALLSATASRAADDKPPESSRRLSHGNTVGMDAHPAPTPRENFRLVRVAPDPIVGFNRGSFAVSKFALDWVLHPLARGWRFITPSFVRTGVDNFAYNIAFPVRFVSLLLQGRPIDTAQETGHFLVDSTVGLAGFFEVGTPLGIPTHRADVGLAFARWGFGPGFYFVIPFIGPSSGRDAVGKIFDTALSPTTYIPGVGIFFQTNHFASRLDTYDAVNKTDLDVYGLVRAMWSIRRHIDATRYEIPEEAYATADPEPSLGVLAFRVKDKEFPGRAKERSVVSARTEREVPYSLWLQKGKAPIVFVIPGIGAHRASTNPVALAEGAFARGYSVAIVSSPFHPEFILTGLSNLYAGNTPDDAEDLEAVLRAIRQQLDRDEPGRVGSARLMGYSMGAIESLFLAERDKDEADGLRFERVVAINPPVDLAYSAQGFDGYFDAPAKWPEAEREQRLIELAMKAFLVAQEGLPEGKPFPLSRIESEFLIGLSGRTTIVNAIGASAQRGGKTLAVTEGEDEHEGALFSEINEGSLANYGRELAVPYFQETKGASRDVLWNGANLRRHESFLRSADRVRAFTNRNDFILGAENLRWLEGVMGDRLVVFPDGGHLGNLYVPAVQEKILDALGPAGEIPAASLGGRVIPHGELDLAGENVE